MTDADDRARDTPALCASATDSPVAVSLDLVVRVVGHVEIAGWMASTERRLIMEDLCCFLAFAERAMSTAEVQEAIWPLEGERGEATVKTVHNTIGRLRQAVGAEHFPDAVTAGGYRLQGVATDWGEITRLLEVAAGASVDESTALRLQVLAHVRGAPFEGAHATQFHWAFVSGLVSLIARTLSDCAHELSGELLDAGDASGAEWAARQGLKVSSTDERLSGTAARAAAMLGTGACERVWRDAAAALGSASDRRAARVAGSGVPQTCPNER